MTEEDAKNWTLEQWLCEAEKEIENEEQVIFKYRDIKRYVEMHILRIWVKGDIIKRDYCEQK